MATGLKLYEAVEALGLVNGWIDEHADELLAAGGELSPELAELLDQAEGDFAEKVERVALKVRSLEAEAAAIKVEEARLSQRRKAVENAAASLKQYLHRGLDAAGEKKVKGTLVTVALQANPPAVAGELTREQLEERYMESKGADPFVTLVPESFTLNKKAVLEAFRAERPLPEGVSVVQGVSLRIR